MPASRSPPPCLKDSDPVLRYIGAGAFNGIQKTELDEAQRKQAAAPRPLYQYPWFSDGFAQHRRRALRTYFYSNIVNWLIVWASVSLLYGTYIRNDDLGKLEVFVVNFDDDSLGSQVVDAFEVSLERANHLRLIFRDTFASIQEVRDAVYDEQAWGAVIVNAAATQRLRQALVTGNSSYDPTSAIEVVSEGARNPLTSNSHLVPAILAILEPVIVQASMNASATFLSANLDNATAIRTALNCPQCLSSGFSYLANDLRPAYSPSAFGAVLSGAIALITFSFTVAGTANKIGILLGEYLNITSTIAWRWLSCMFAYFIIALSITGIQAAFGIPVTTPFGGRGFVILWMLNWMTVSAFGLAIEAIVTVFGFWTTNWFLNFWVFWNSAGASYSNELMPGFYKYGYGFPLVHAIRGTSTIIYGTKSHLGLNFSVLMVWIVVSSVVMAVATTLRLRCNMRRGVHTLP
ncbi:predicted protein [Sparassis crispa]|uniref:DUF3533 domain-containing protein n=1 Tax=Sparassis crispa TaxID=139825 RepID=A0A401GFE9_9APHY|nr:predicted protein [Sparassis crispa]GBE80924.1 predicted protein [Sparassis crispa]